jgi:hypothetical protein
MEHNVTKYILLGNTLRIEKLLTSIILICEFKIVSLRSVRNMLDFNLHDSTFQLCDRSAFDHASIFLRRIKALFPLLYFPELYIRVRPCCQMLIVLYFSTTSINIHWLLISMAVEG